MKVNTRKRKESRKVFKQLYGSEELTDRMSRIISQGIKRLEKPALYIQFNNLMLMVMG